MDINQIRRENLRALAGRYQTRAEFAAVCGTAPSVLSLILSPNPTRNLGTKLARKIEAATDTPLGWLDVAHGSEHHADTEGLPVALANKIRSYRPVVEIERLDIAASMGPGAEPPGLNMVVEHMRLDAAWVRQNLTYTAVENLKLIPGRGDSMSPTIRHGDALLVDVGVRSIESDAIYFFEMQGQLLVKRIQRSLDGLMIISDNPQYREIQVPAARISDITVLAQIIYWWTGRIF